MEALTTVSRHYNQISEKLRQLDNMVAEAEKNGLSDDQMKNFEAFTDFVDRDIKNQLRIEEELLTEIRRQLGEQRSKDIRQVISEHDVLYGALDQFVYGVRMQSEPDIMESAKSMLEHFPGHIERVDSIAQRQPQMLH